jgi:hypothetical protein
MVSSDVVGRRYVGLDVFFVGIACHEATQIDPKGRALPDLGVNLHMSTGLLNKSVHLAQFQASPASHGLSGEKRLEGSRDSRFVHTLASIRHIDANIL